MININKIKALVIALIFILPDYACKTVKPEDNIQPITGKYEQQMAKLDKGFGIVPFYERGSQAFSGKSAILRMDERRKKNIEEEKEKFIVNATERFKGIENVYWIPPPENTEVFKALELFPKDAFGYPDWTAAVKIALIAPIDLSRKRKFMEESNVFNQDIIFKINDRMMANVRFPHNIHNYWLSCKICHPGIFIPKKGANDFGMDDIWAGKYCGRCHGRVAFQPKGFENCIRCHSVKRREVVF